MTAAVPFHSNNLLTRSDNEFAMCATQQIRNQPHFTPKFSSEHEYKLNKLLTIVKGHNSTIFRHKCAKAEGVGVA